MAAKQDKTQPHTGLRARGGKEYLSLTVSQETGLGLADSWSLSQRKNEVALNATRPTHGQAMARNDPTLPPDASRRWPSSQPEISARDLRQGSRTCQPARG